MKAVLAMVALLALVAFAGWANADDESATLEERVKALEERLGAMERGGEGSDIRVRSLTVVDDDGKPRVILGKRPGCFGLSVQDELGRPRIVVGIDSHGNARIALLERETARRRLSMALLHDDAPYISLGSPNSALRIEAPHEGAVGIGMWGGPGKQNERSHAGFWIWDDGTIAWGGGQRSAGRTGFHLQQSRDGVFDFFVCDHEEALLWEMPQHAPPKPYAVQEIRVALESHDEAQQRKGIEALSAALASDDPRLVLKALWLVRKTGDVEYDRAAMERLVRKHLDSPYGRTRVKALMTLLYVRGFNRGDVESALRVADTEDLAVLFGVASPLLSHAQKKVEGGAIEAAFLRLLQHERIEVALGAAQALTQARTSVAIHEALIALWREHRGRYHQVVLGLARVKPRSLPIVKALLEELGLPDIHGLHRDVRTALGNPKTDEAKAVTVAGALRLLGVAKSEESRTSLVSWLMRFGTSSDADKLERLLASASFPTNIQRFGKMALRQMRQR